MSDNSGRSVALVVALKLSKLEQAGNAVESIFHPFKARKTLSAVDVLTIRTVIGSATPKNPILNTATLRLHHNAIRAMTESATPMIMKALNGNAGDGLACAGTHQTRNAPAAARIAKVSGGITLFVISSKVFTLECGTLTKVSSRENRFPTRTREGVT